MREGISHIVLTGSSFILLHMIRDCSQKTSEFATYFGRRVMLAAVMATYEALLIT